MSLLLVVGTHGLAGLLIQFLIIFIAILIIAGLIYAIETWIIKASLPQFVRLIIGLILIVILIIWALGIFGAT